MVLFRFFTLLGLIFLAVTLCCGGLFYYDGPRGSVDVSYSRHGGYVDVRTPYYSSYSYSSPLVSTRSYYDSYGGYSRSYRRSYEGYDRSHYSYRPSSVYLGVSSGRSYSRSYGPSYSSRGGRSNYFSNPTYSYGYY